MAPGFRSHSYDNQWKVEVDLRRDLDKIGLQYVKLTIEDLVYHIKEQAFQIQSAEDDQTLYRNLSDHADKLAARVGELTEKLVVEHTNNILREEHLDKYGDHLEECATYEGLDSGRIIDVKECDCGWIKKKDATMV